MTSPKYSGKPKRPKRPLLLRRVTGQSMTPGLRPGQILVATPYGIDCSAGKVIIIHHDGIEKVKRITKTQKHMLFVVGDNLSKSTDSRQFGWINQSRVVGRVIWPRGL